MSTTVAVGGFEVTSNHEDASAMVESLTPAKEEKPQPKVIRDKGEPVEAQPKEGLSKAASELGKKGGEAAAKARKASEKEQAGNETESDPHKSKQTKDEPGNETVNEAETKRGNPRHDPTARVAEATREAREARRERDELRARLDAVERQQRASTPPQPRQEAIQERPADDDPEPQLEDFEHHHEWVRAQIKWEQRQGFKGLQREAQAHRVASEHAQRVEGSMRAFEDAFKAGGPDLTSELSQEVLSLIPSMFHNGPPTADNWIADEFLSDPDNAVRLMRHLTENDEEFQRIRTLQSPRAVTRALANIRPEAATAGTSTRREVSQAHPPVRPVTGSPHIAEPDESTMSFEQLARSRGIKPKR